MRHLWVIEEKQSDEEWTLMSSHLTPEVFLKKRHAQPHIREWRTCMPDHYRYRVVKYVPEVKK